MMQKIMIYKKCNVKETIEQIIDIYIKIQIDICNKVGKTVGFYIYNKSIDKCQKYNQRLQT